MKVFLMSEYLFKQKKQQHSKKDIDLYFLEK